MDQLSKMNISSYLPAMPYVVRELFDKATNIVMNYSETEAKVVEATNDESWGPPGKLLQDLSQLSYSHENYNELIGMLWKRCFGQDKKYWRRTYKSLLVLTYLIKNGSDKVVTSAREHLYDLKSLENFAHHDEHGKDQGINIRHKVKELIEFIQDDDRIRDERKRAKANRDKYIGMSNESSSHRYSDRWNDNDESYSTKKKDFHDSHEYRKSKSEQNFTKTKDFVSNKSQDYSADISDEENQNSKSTSWKKDQKNEIQNKPKFTTTNNKPITQAPVVDLLGDDVEFTPYVQASQDEDFGQFQEAVSPSSPIQPSLWPTPSTQTTSSSDTFDPFASFESSTNLFQTTNKTPSNDLDLFSMPQTQPTMFLPNQQQLFTRPTMFQQQTMMQSSVQPQTHANLFNNTWSSAQGKLDISLNNLIPHTRGDPHRNGLPLNQLTSPTSPTSSGFPSFNANTQPIFSNSNKK
ncbi:unnamed protein product [Adineta steineri]|uniref:ENTH domain-containing protein n=1 Tax=Adineta steineri TaxID=433720 RepID=A0A819F6S2_9BILA|nr:unnamed protein product [Adineta steineri]CAF3862764.1 unnamed protein product [Adineta steineri]